MNIRPFLIAMPLAAAIAGQAFAHHSFAMFDQTKQVSLKGRVKEFEWVNPHSWLRVTVDDKATGRPAQWAFEMGSPGQQAQRGWKPDSVKPGDKVTVSFHPLKDGSRGGQLLSAALPNGQQLGNGGQRNNPVE